MAKFRDSSMLDAPSTQLLEVKPRPPERQIGEILQDTANLSAEQVERVLAYMRERGVRFGEAAVALGFVSADDVMYALAQQFHYPYAPEERRHLNPELVTLNQPFSPQAEAFRAIRSQLMMRVFNEGDRRRALAVISPDAADGKTYFAANVAVTLAQLGGRTLLVDADMRKPRLHEVFSLENSAGLSSILAGRAEAQVIQQVMGVPSLFVLPVGVVPPNPLELVERPAFGILMRELTAKFDHVVVDTPAAEYGTDAQVVANRCGAAVVVARRNESRVNELQELVASLSESSVQMAGVIINDF
jgi:chain length determinant protein tyrosine kinase EpsG